jgi:DNA-binding IclR family transcriptional regulator
MVNHDISKNRYSSLENALRFLNLFSYESPELYANDIALKLDVANSTVHRLAVTLIEEGFLTKDPRNNTYRLGASILSLTQIVKNTSQLYCSSKPFIDTLAKACNETVNLGILRDLDIIYLYTAESSQAISVNSHITDRTGLHCTAIGQLLLAYQSNDIFELLKDSSLPKYTSKTLTSHLDLLKRFDDIKKQGYSISFDEQYEGISSISAPILNKKNKAIAAVSISGRTQRIKNAAQPLINQLKATADNISKALADR